MCRCTCLPPSLFYEIVSYLAKAPKGTVFGARPLGTFLPPQMSDACKGHPCNHTGHKGMRARAADMCMNVTHAHRMWACHITDIDQFQKKAGQVSWMETCPARAMAKACACRCARKKGKANMRSNRGHTLQRQLSMSTHLVCTKAAAVAAPRQLTAPNEHFGRLLSARQISENKRPDAQYIGKTRGKGRISSGVHLGASRGCSGCRFGPLFFCWPPSPPLPPQSSCAAGRPLTSLSR